METKQRWQDWVNLILGIWLFVSPFFGIGVVSSIAAWNGYLFGVVIAGLSIWALIKPQAWEEWINLGVGVWLLVSLVFPGYIVANSVMWNQIVVGLIVGADAIWAALSKRHTPMQHA